MELIYLSHNLSESTPAYGGGPSLVRTPSKSISRGDSCNQINFSMSNHLGTHVDAPLHFSVDGLSITDYPASFWRMSPVALIEVATPAGGLLDLRDCSLPFTSELELLLIKTGFGKFRGQPLYWSGGPGILAESADHLRMLFPNLKMIGFDFISLTSFLHREEGRRAHRAFLGGEKPILVMEDMNLSSLSLAPKEVLVSPLRLERGDGAPVTVFAQI